MSVFARLTMLGLISLVLASCESTPGKTDSIGRGTITAEQSIESLLAQAENAQPQLKVKLLLQAAEALVKQGDLDRARSIINNLPYHANSDYGSIETKAHIAFINSIIAYAHGQYVNAYELLDQPSITQNISRLPNALATKILGQRAELLFNLGDYEASVKERIALHSLVLEDLESSHQNEQKLWQTLMTIPSSELATLSTSSESRELQGWYQLALLSKDTQTNIREQLERLDRWQRDWPDHPASVSLPADLKMLQQLLAEQPNQVALLLPMTGRLSSAAKAIRDGFLAAFYQQPENERPELHFYDTNNADIHDLYDLAISNGAQLIIGPLEKELVQDLATRPSLPIPTLALNAIDNPMGVVPNLYQFGLGVEDEARVAAVRAWRDGHRRAMILAPESNWGDRSTYTFAQTWRELGGEVVQEYRFNERSDYSKVIKQALQLDQSEKRAQEIRSIVGNIEFEPRRRQDIDMIFLAAQAGQARQIKPTLAFHYAGGIPVYATSHVYSGTPNAQQDQDMNGIKFSTLPWFFNRQTAEKKNINQYGDSNASLQPLYAMGVDSFHLYPRLKQLDVVQQANFYGQTGTLRLNEFKQFEREQVWAEFKNGRPRLLADPVQ